MAAKTQKRFRSNYFGPKVKRPKTFELTKRGHKLLKEATKRCRCSVGDLVEFFLIANGDEAEPNRMAAIAAKS